MYEQEGTNITRTNGSQYVLSILKTQCQLEIPQKAGQVAYCMICLVLKRSDKYYIAADKSVGSSLGSCVDC